MARDWSRRKHADRYWRAAKREGWRSRAAFKLLQLNDRFKIIRKGNVVVDLGAAPGGWSQVARMLVGREGRVVAVDVARMLPVPGVESLTGDLTKPETVDVLAARLPAGADVVISDMAPNISGSYSYDHARSVHLVQTAAEVARRFLRPGGTFLAKVFSGDMLDDIRRGMRDGYEVVKTTKPAASRSQSAEVYLIATGFRGRPVAPASPTQVSAGGAP